MRRGVLVVSSDLAPHNGSTAATPVIRQSTEVMIKLTGLRCLEYIGG